MRLRSDHFLDGVIGCRIEIGGDSLGENGGIIVCGGGEFLLQLGVPVVLDIIVCSTWEMRCYDRPPASYVGVECEDDLIFFICKTAVFDVWSEIIQPS